MDNTIMCLAVVASVYLTVVACVLNTTWRRQERRALAKIRRRGHDDV